MPSTRIIWAWAASAVIITRESAVKLRSMRNWGLIPAGRRMEIKWHASAVHPRPAKSCANSMREHCIVVLNLVRRLLAYVRRKLSPRRRHGAPGLRGLSQNLNVDIKVQACFNGFCYDLDFLNPVYFAKAAIVPNLCGFPKYWSLIDGNVEVWPQPKPDLVIVTEIRGGENVRGERLDTIQDCT
jgi:hypothetical protein